MECIEWKRVRSDGYGVMKVRGKRWLVHRLVWTRVWGPIPPGHVVRHTCDNPSCYRLSHLTLGTQADNLRDARERGRRRVGDRHWMSKLTAADIPAIRADPRPARLVAEDYGVHKSSIVDVRSGKTWSHA